MMYLENFSPILNITNCIHYCMGKTYLLYFYNFLQNGFFNRKWGKNSLAFLELNKPSFTMVYLTSIKDLMQPCC